MKSVSVYNLSIALVILYNSLCGFAQVDSAKSIKVKSFYLEIFGNGIIYSVNFDNIFIQGDNYKYSYRIGYGVFPTEYNLPEWNPTGLTSVIPLQICYLRGRANSYLEAGLGMTPILQLSIDTSGNSTFTGSFALIPNTGWRLNGRNDIQFRLIFNPIILLAASKTRIVPFMGISFGILKNK